MMKNISFLLVILCCSCVEKSVDFLEPQPANTKNIKQFSPELMGIYESLEGDSKMEIQKTCIIESGNYDIKLSKAELDTSKEFILKDNILFSTADNTQIAVQQRNDSVFGLVPWTDTAFLISQSNLLRKLKGYYFLNEYTSDTVWKVVRMKLEDKVLLMATMNKKKEADEIKKYTTLYYVAMNNDTITSYKLKPSKKEFKKMVDSKLLFTDQQKFIKVKP